jgi:hypothetical protein
MIFPYLNSSQLAVMMADSQTGVILNKDYKVYMNDSDDQVYLVFENIEKVNDFIKEVSMKYQQIEFVIYNSNKEVVDFIKARE